jgi:TPR repeat protein
MNTISMYLLLAASVMVQAPTSLTPHTQEETAKPIPLSSAEINRLKGKAEAGDASAQTALGHAYEDGKGLPQSQALAAKWFRRAADQGDADAEGSLGIMYGLGEGVERNKEEAVRWYQKAAKQGNAKAMFNLGASYYNGDGVAIDDVTSYVWFLLAQEAGNPAADEAVQRAASEKSVSPSAAFVKVAQMYEVGDVLPKNSVGALKWYRKAADAGDGPAAVKVATLLLVSGRELTQEEYAEVRQRCEAAAKGDFSPGAYCLALIYRRGIGVAKDSIESTKWLSRSAELGHPKAALELGEAYWKGVGVKPDLVTAYMWIWLALNSKVPGAEQDEQELRKELPAKKVSEAKQKAIEWARKHQPLGLRQRQSANSAPSQ